MFTLTAVTLNKNIARYVFPSVTAHISTHTLIISAFHSFQYFCYRLFLLLLLLLLSLLLLLLLMSTTTTACLLAC